MNTEKDGQLLRLYFNWKQKPTEYGQELTDTLNKLIYTLLSRGYKLLNIGTLSTKEDILQDIRYLMIKALHRLQPPLTNKRIYNYLMMTAAGGIMTQNRKLSLYIKRRGTESEYLSVKEQPHVIFNFGDELTDTVATMLSNKYNKTEICRELKITTSKLKSVINKIKEAYV